MSKGGFGICEYLKVDPFKDYWYPDLVAGTWYVHRSDGKCYEVPIRDCDYLNKENEGVKNEPVDKLDG